MIGIFDRYYNEKKIYSGIRSQWPFEIFVDTKKIYIDPGIYVHFF